TVGTFTPELIMKAIENVVTCPQPEDGARHLGIHVEGPYLNVEHRGAQQKDLIRKPDAVEFQKWLDTGVVKLITIAPEIEKALEFIDLGSGGLSLSSLPQCSHSLCFFRGPLLYPPLSF
ncbi:unnamed protein product, partial [marine sediment metagenome]